jgi:hypothetical protein
VSHLELPDKGDEGEQQGRPHSAHEGDGRQGVHLPDLGVVLGQFGAQDEELRGAHRVADVVDLGLAGRLQNKVDRCWQVVNSHLMETDG